MSNLVEFAQNELSRLLKKCTDSEDLRMQQTINNDILNVIKQFSEQGHTGTTAQYCISVLTSLLSWRPLSPLTGEDDEWDDVSKYYNNKHVVFQNKRCPAVFKEDGKCFNVEGKIFTEDGGHTWYTSRDSRVEITFPYTVPISPEEVHIDRTNERRTILNHLLNVFDECNILYDKDLINEDTILGTLVPKIGLQEFVRVTNKKFSIKKPRWNIQEDDLENGLWSYINYIIESQEDEEVED